MTASNLPTGGVEIERLLGLLARLPGLGAALGTAGGLASFAAARGFDVAACRGFDGSGAIGA